MRKRPHIAAEEWNGHNAGAAISLRDASRYLGCKYQYVLLMVYHPERLAPGTPILESMPKPGSNRRQTTRAMCDHYRQALETAAERSPASRGLGTRPRSVVARRRSMDSRGTRSPASAPLGAPALSPLVGSDLLKSIGF
jgi:hypothetical protein